MPLRSGSVTFARFQADLPPSSPSESRRWLAKALRTHAFEPLVPGGEEERSAGFVELEDPDATEFAPGDVHHGGVALFGFRIDAIRIPSSALKAELARWSAAFEAEHGRPPARRERASGRDAVRQALRQRTPPRTTVHEVSLDPATGAVRIWAGSRSAVEEVAAAVEGAFAVKLRGHAALALAARTGVDVERLRPTAELVGGDALAGAAGATEAGDGEA
jgi:recombination associated protein RdgC